LREWSGCRCVGVRILDPGGQAPYAAQVGFSRSFLREESAKSFDDLDCPCVRALTGRTLPGDHRCVTGGNSFFSEKLRDDLSHLCPSMRERGALACQKAGYQSMVQTGIRYDGQLIGMLHLADLTPGKVPQETIDFVESVAPLIGEALHRFQVEQALAESEEQFRALFEKHDEVMLLVSPGKWKLVDANPAACAYFSRTRDQMVRCNLPELGVNLPRKASVLHAKGARRAMEPFEARLTLGNGEMRAISVHCSAVSVRRQRLLFLIIHDITERKLLQQRILEISEQERQRVGQDLHDSLGGHLTGLALMGKALTQRLKEAKSADISIAREVVEGLNKAISQTRAIAHGLCPVEQNQFGLLSSIHEYVGEVRRRAGIQCDFASAGNLPNLPALVSSHLLRIMQEAVSNALIHAKPRQISVTLTATDKQVFLKVWNDGLELSPHFGQKKGLGLRTMKYRADLIGARFEIRPAPGGGTIASCFVPVDRETPAKSQGRQI